MKKLKILVMGIGLTGTAVIGTSFFASSEVEAQREPTTNCEWNGKHCKNPQVTNMCWCE